MENERLPERGQYGTEGPSRKVGKGRPVPSIRAREVRGSGGVTRSRIGSEEEDLTVEALVHRLQAGEPVSHLLESLLHPQLTAYTRSLAPDLSSADQEIVGERAIFKACAQIDRFDETRASFPTWVRGFVKNELRDFRRGRADQQERLAGTPVTTVEDLLASWSGPRRRTTGELLAELAPELSSNDEEILRLHMRGFTHEQIARRLTISEPTARQRYSRAVRRLEKLPHPRGPRIDLAFGD